MTEHRSLDAFGRAGLFLTVFLTGASVMVIELLGTRLIAPFYGASLFVWSSLISVTMIALALGYFLGGLWADSARRTGLAPIIALAGFLTLSIPWATRPVLSATDGLGLRLGAFVSALTLFAPGLTFLGMVGPFAVKLAAARLDRVGNSAGSIYAISTVGSVIGTLILGFYLFPLVGSREILIGAGALLLVLAVAVGLCERKPLGSNMALVACLALAAAGFAALPKIVSAGHAYSGTGKYNVLFERESLYGWVRVIDYPKRDLRLLTSDASVIGASSISRSESQLTYQDIVNLIPGLRPAMRRALIVGLGAGHMVKGLFEERGMGVDVMEIDPAVAEAAALYFGYVPRGQTVIGDARREIRKLQGPYDLIVHDCFTGGSEPAHLLTLETLTQLRGLLTPQGILALNLVAFSRPPNNLALASVARTIGQVFPYHSVFASEPGKDFTDFIVLASASPIDLDDNRLAPQQIDWLKARLFSADEAQGQLLTDNLNPLEALQNAKSERYRQFMVEMFGPDLFIR